MNSKSKIKLIVSDIEGCIMPTARNQVNINDLKDVANYCQAVKDSSSFPPLVFCTGRQSSFVECLSQITGAIFPNYPSIVENGAYIYDVGKNKTIPNPILTIEILKKVEVLRKLVDKWMVDIGGIREPGKEICISLNPPNQMSIEDLNKEAKRKLKRYLEFFEITHSSSAVDITPKGINKASGRKHLVEYCKVGANKILGIGDSNGDLPMIDLVGFSACPSNATINVKEKVIFISSQAEIKGFIEIIKYFTDWELIKD